MPACGKAVDVILTSQKYTTLCMWQGFKYGFPIVKLFYSLRMVET